MSFFCRPPFWRASTHSTIPQPIYRLAAQQVVERWLLEASDVTTLGQARKDLARLSLAATSIGQDEIARNARLWHQRLPSRPPLHDPLGEQIRQFFLELDETDDLMLSISASERALSVFDPNEIDFRAEELAAQEDNILTLVGILPDRNHVNLISTNLTRILRHLYPQT